MRRWALLLLVAPLPIAAAEPDTAPEQESEHVVQRGETLMGIAARAEVPRVLIAEANGLKPPYALRAGQKLRIPRTRRHKVASGDTGFSIALDFGVPWRTIAVANGLDPKATIRPGQVLLIPTVIAPPAEAEPVAAPLAKAAPARAAATSRFAWPLAGPLRRGFAARRRGDYHDGIDIRVAQGTVVRAVDDGRVLFAGEEPRQFGKLVVIDHGGGWHSAYGFLGRITVKRGERVGQGERVGLSGRTGLAKGPELHFELRRDNRPVDPLPHLPPR